MIIGYRYDIDETKSLSPPEDPVISVLTSPIVSRIPRTAANNIRSYYSICDLTCDETPSIRIGLGLGLKGHRLPKNLFINVLEDFTTNPFTIMGDIDKILIVVDDIYSVIARATLQAYTSLKDVSVIEKSDLDNEKQVYPDTVISAGLRTNRSGYDMLISLLVSNILMAKLNNYGSKDISTLASIILSYIYKSILIGFRQKYKSNIYDISMTTRLHVPKNEAQNILNNICQTIKKENTVTKEMIDEIIINEVFRNNDILKQIFGSYMYPRTKIKNLAIANPGKPSGTIDNLIRKILNHKDNLVKDNLGEKLKEKYPAIHITSQFNLLDLYIASLKLIEEGKREIYALATQQTIRVLHMLLTIMNQRDLLKRTSKDKNYYKFEVKDLESKRTEKIRIYPVIIPSTINPGTNPLSSKIMQKTINILRHRSLPLYLTKF